MMRIECSTEAEWLAHRRGGIGASEAGAILGLDDYKTAFEVYAEKVGLLQPKEDNEAMWLGREMEPIVAKRFATETGKAVTPNGRTIYQSDEYPWMRATPDYWVDAEDAGLECKTMGQMMQYRLDDGEIPPGYYCQCMHTMAVTGASTWYLAIYRFGDGLHWYRIEYNTQEISALIEAERMFWAYNVMAGIPPAMAGTAGEDRAVKAATPRATSGKDMPLYHLADIVRRSYELGETIKASETERDALIQTIKLEMQDAEYGLTPDYKVVWKQGFKNRPFTIRRTTNE